MTRKAFRLDMANLLIPLQGCMKQPVTGRTGRAACKRVGNNRKPALDGREAEIKQMLANGGTITGMAGKLGVARKTLRKYMEMKGLRDCN